MRKTKEVTVTADGRDKGKRFLLTELPATRTEKWATRVFQGLASSGVEVPEDLVSLGAAGLAALGLQAIGRIGWPVLESLLDEMMTTVQIREPALTRALTEDDVEEVTTLVLLRKEWFELHLGFLTTAAQSILAANTTMAQA